MLYNDLRGPIDIDAGKPRDTTTAAQRTVLGLLWTDVQYNNDIITLLLRQNLSTYDYGTLSRAQRDPP